MSNRAQDLGQRFTCFKCECKFYDLCSPEPLCPRCGADQREDLGTPSPPSKRRASRAKKAKVVTPPRKGELLDVGEDDLLDDSFAAGGSEGLPEGKEKSGPAEEPKAKKAAAKKAAAKKPAAKKPAAKKAAKKPAAKKAAKKPAAKKAAKKPAAKK